MSAFQRARQIVFTINNPTEEDELFTDSVPDPINYVIVGHEEGDSGTYHLQGYAQFTKALVFNTIKRLFPRAHIEAVKGTVKQAIDYCKKDGNFDEYGELRTQGKKSSNKAAYEKIKERINVNRDPLINVIRDCENTAQVKFAEIMEKYVSIGDDVSKKEVFWFFGPTGSGKTRMAFEMSNKESLWMSSENLKWFDGYSGQEDVIVDDFRGDFTTFHFLLRLLDRYPLNVPIKGGFVRWMPKRIFITCPFPPKDAYQGIEDKRQLYRRISQVRYFGNSLEDLMNYHNEDYDISHNCDDVIET